MEIGDFEGAWRESDRVLAARDRSGRDDPRLPYHLRWVWDGRSFRGRRVLVRCYHGLGDTLQFCRFLVPLARVVKHLAVEVQPELLDLLKTLEGPDELLPFRPAEPMPSSKCDIEVMELSHALRLAPTPTRYLFVRQSRPLDRLRVGVCWQSSLSWSNDRSLPPQLLDPLFACQDIEFVSLQREGRSLQGLSGSCPHSIIDTAKLISELDVVISVDTMVAHLAGALGVPLWLLLKADPDWRWLAGGEGSVWYARVRKYRQQVAGDWETPMKALLEDLRARATEHLAEQRWT